MAKPIKPKEPTFFKADNPNIKYVGRVDFSNPSSPRFWNPGVYLQAKFKGTSLAITVNDELLYGVTHNYIEIAIDNDKPFRIATTGKTSILKVANNLAPGTHTVTICKDTESGIGYIEFVGITCDELLAMHSPKKKIEFIGDSITCGTGIDLSVSACDKGNWYDQHNAYLSYGPCTARLLDAEWQLTAVSGIGLIHSCCDLKITMPTVFDKVDLRADTIQWNFKKYIPDVVTICLGQNDGNQDSVTFCSAYVNFIKQIRSHYPKADIVCLNSPMGNQDLTRMLKSYIGGIQKYMNENGDERVSHFFFPGGYNNGCGSHPDMAQQQLVAQQLSVYLKQLENW
ncbi:SGNH/GDSL hydrolase family protein [Mucilaginibacter sp.]